VLELLLRIANYKAKEKVMKARWIWAFVPVFAAIGSCGESQRGDAGEIVTTNAGDIVLNDAHANHAFKGDNEQVGSQQTPAGGNTGSGSAGNTQ
jgi:hypothetical protein